MAFIERPQNNNNTLDLCFRFDYFGWTLTTSSYTHNHKRTHISSPSFSCSFNVQWNIWIYLFVLPFLFPACLSCSGAQEPLHVFWRCRLNFQVTSLSPHRIQYTIWSHLLQQLFEVYLHCDWLPGVLFSLLCLSPSFSSSPFLPFCVLSDSFSLDLSDSPFLFSVSLFVFLSFSSSFFNSSIHSLLSFLFCLWAENGLKGMRSWRAVSTVIIWLLPALLTAEDVPPLATLCFIISGEL